MAARRLHYFIYVTIINCILFLVVCSIALATNTWFKAEATGDGDQLKVKVTVSYGLFTGKKSKFSGSLEQKYKLKIVCQGWKNCMFSCGHTADMRKQDFENLLNGGSMADQEYCLDEISSKTARNETLDQETLAGHEMIFINFGMYVATIAFISLGMFFAVIGGVLALYNTYRTPFQPILSPSGLYAWNGIAAGSVLLAIIMWAVEYFTKLAKNAAISDTISGNYDTNGGGSLGISFWILILPVFFALLNIGILKYRAWKIIKNDEKNVKVITEQIESGDILLF